CGLGFCSLASPSAAAAKEHSKSSFRLSLSAGTADLGARIHERFRVQVEEEQIELRPIENDSVVRSIELADGESEASVNGKAFSAAELSAFLGKDGELVAELAALDAEGRREALGAGAKKSAADDEEAAIADGRRESEREAARRGVPPPPPPPPVPGGRVHVDSEGDDRVSFGRAIEVRAGESAGDVVCIGCSVTVFGQVDGDAVAVGGSVLVESGGLIQGNAVGVGGRVHLESGATVDGDAVAVGGSVQVEDGGTIEGQRSSVGWGDGMTGHGRSGWPLVFRSEAGELFWSLLRGMLLALLCCVSLLLARGPLEHTSKRLAEEPWKAVFAGLLTQLLFFPVLLLVTLILAVSIIGIPLLVLVPVALLAGVLAAIVGFAAVAQSLGRWAAGRFGWHLVEPYIPVLVGVALIQGVAIVARIVGIPGSVFGLVAIVLLAFGFFLKYVAWTMGLGAMTLSLLGRDWRRPRGGTAMPPASPPTTPASTFFAPLPPAPPAPQTPPAASAPEGSSESFESAEPVEPATSPAIVFPPAIAPVADPPDVGSASDDTLRS
ncbi:MAG: polymer-forming cytoskeletal protein, partial [Thermoanaerobaculia bacterium]